MKEDIQIIEVDLFCGAGGVTTGSEKAMINGVKICKTIACVNHDYWAIQSHSANHKKVYHFIEDIRTMDLQKLIEIVCYYRTLYPNAKLLLWASLECTNFSKAKGGLPREADSRTLADSLFRYIEAIDPDLIFIENVEEFMSWGPLDKNGRPESKTAGKDYLRWIHKVKSYGYDFDYRILNSADFGAYTSRRRYFGQFAKYGIPISWPEPTHSKVAKSDMFGSFKKWKPVREVLDLHDEGESIFGRKIPLVEKSLERIYYGLEKFVPRGEDKFITKYFSGKPKYKSSSIESPASTITTVCQQALINTKFLTAYYSGGGQLHSIEKPCPTVPTNDRFSYVSCQFLDKQYGSGRYNNQDIQSPAGTITGNPKFNLVSAKWIMDTNFNNIGTSIDQPAPTIMACRKHHYLLDAQYRRTGNSIDKPCFTLIARMDKTPPYLITFPESYKKVFEFKYLGGVAEKQLYVNTSNYINSYHTRIRIFMYKHGIIDIKMRMLNIQELKRITGFPENYVLLGTQADQKKFIGNAVPVVMAQKLIEAAAEKLMNNQLQNVA